MVSTTGGVSVPGVSGADEDLLAFAPTSLGATTAGTWSMYFDGSDVELNTSSSEDVNGMTVDADGGIVLTTVGSFTSGALSGTGSDAFTCASPGTGVELVYEPEPAVRRCCQRLRIRRGGRPAHRLRMPEPTANGRAQ